MSNTVIGATLQVTDNASGPMKDVTKANADLQKGLKETGNAAKDTSKSISEAGGSFGNLKSQMSALPGPLKDASEGVTSLSDAFKAMLANPVVLVITAIVGALAFLYKSFTNTAAGGEKMEQVFAGIKAAAGAVLDAIFDLGGAIIKFFSGDFKGAFDQAKKAITGVVDAATDAYNQVSKLTAQAQELHKEQLKNDLDQAKRAKDLAVLREQATDPSIEVGKRKAALLELQKAAKEDAEKDVKLAKETAENKIALLSVGKDAALKNRDEINAARIEQIRVETDAANEQRRIGKQITAANKEELAQRKADAAAAREEAKKNREQLEAFTSQLRKIHKETTLAGITDQYTKETQLLEDKIEDENAAIKKQFADGKITRSQFNELTLAQDENAAIRRLALIDKHNKELEDAEEKHQQELEKIRLEAIKKEEADRAAETARQKKKFDEELKTKGGIANDPKAAFAARKVALDAETKLNKDAFDKRLIDEDIYNDNVRRFADDRLKIEQEELAAKFKMADQIAGLFTSLSQAIGEQTAAGKAFAVASATIATIESAVKSFNAMADIPIVGPALGAVAAAAALVSGYGNVKKILSVEVPGQTTGSASGPTATAPVIPSAPIAPRQASTKLDAASIDSIGANVQPLRAYVVESDNSAAANRAARLSAASKLGG